MAHLTKEQNKEITQIIMGLVARNMQNELSFEEAKDKAFNRILNEHPLILTAWMEDNLNINTLNPQIN